MEHQQMTRLRDHHPLEMEVAVKMRLEEWKRWKMKTRKPLVAIAVGKSEQLPMRGMRLMMPEILGEVSVGEEKQPREQTKQSQRMVEK